MPIRTVPNPLSTEGDPPQDLEGAPLEGRWGPLKAGFKQTREVYTALWNGGRVGIRTPGSTDASWTESLESEEAPKDGQLACKEGLRVVSKMP